MTKIQYASDLHLEFAANQRWLKEHPLKKAADILVLAGDILYFDHEQYRQHPFWDSVASDFEQVLVVPGNHEFYKYFDLKTMTNGFSYDIRENVHLYYNKVVHVADVDFILSTLWAHIPDDEANITEHYVSDFYKIRYGSRLLTAATFNEEHERCRMFIEKSTAESHAAKKIVVTHHVPSFQLSHTIYEGSHINGAFTVEMADFIKQSNVNAWIYGHSHQNIDRKIGNTQCVSNQLGYITHDEHWDFLQDKTIDV